MGPHDFSDFGDVGRRLDELHEQLAAERARAAQLEREADAAGKQLAMMSDELAVITARAERAEMNTERFAEQADAAEEKWAAAHARAEAAERHTAAIVAAIEHMDTKMTRLGDESGEWVEMYQVLAGPWHRVLGLARAAVPPPPPPAAAPGVERVQAIREFVARVEARAEVDMMAGNPLTGAHYRAMKAELAALDSGAREGAPE